MALREILAHFGIDVDTEELEKANKSVDNFIDRLKSLGTAVIGGEATKELFEFAEGIAEKGEALEKAGIRLGITTDALQELGYAASQSGSDIGSVTFALLTLQDKIGDALINKTGQGAKTFEKLGIAIKDANGHVKDADELLEAVADRISKAKTEAEKNAIAMDVFGRQGKSLLPLLKGGKEGLQKLREEFHALGGGMSKEAVEAAAKYSTQMSKLHAVHDGLTGQIGVKLLPVLDKLIGYLIEGEHAMIAVADRSSLVEAMLGALGVVLGGLAIKSAIAFAPWLAWAAALAAIVLIVDDVVTMLRGGNSVLGDFLDTVGGKGFHVEVVKELKNEWQNVGQAFKDMAPAVKVFLDLLTYIYKFGKGIVETLGQIGGFLGDNAAKLDNYIFEKTGVGGHAQNGAASATSRNDTSVAQNQARLMLQEGAGFNLRELPAYYANRQGGRDEFMAIVKQWADYYQHQAQQAVVSTALYGPAGGAIVFNNTTHVHEAHNTEKTRAVVREEQQRAINHAATRLHRKREAQ